MTLRSLVVLAFLVIAVVCARPVATGETPKVVLADLEYLKAFVARDPVKDADEEQDIGSCLKRTDKVRLIRGTSDVVYGDEHMTLIGQATKYAARYNGLIAKQRGLTTAGGCRPSDIGVQRPPTDGRR